jgi:hypothetical protein
MIITKTCLPRRTVLRGIGATLALPLLDGMVPALSAARQTAAAPVPRLGVFYVPNGRHMGQWTPAAEGTAYELSPTLKPFEPYRDQMLVLTGLNCEPANALGDGGGDHSRASGAFLNGVHPKKSESDVRAGVSMDQVAAQAFGNETQFASLEFAAEVTDFIGACDVGYSCAYSSTIAWRSPTTPLPTEANPRKIFERLFGGGATTDPAARLARVRENRSILDFVTEKVTGLRRELGPRDQLRFAEYLDAVRDVERRIQMAEAQSDREIPLVERPAGIPSTFGEHIRLLFDLQVLAYQTDLTRVVTFLLAKESGANVYPESGVADAHHSASHHGNTAEKLEKVARIDVYHTQTFAYFLEKLKTTPDGDGSLLDHSMILYGGGLSDGNLHTHDNLSILVFGGGRGKLPSGRHLRYPAKTPVTNLYLSMLDKLGVPTERLGDSTGRLEHLADV